MVNKFVNDFSYERVQVDAVLDHALNKIDESIYTSMDNGDELQLTGQYTLCKHTEEGFFWVVDTITWDEVCDVVQVFPYADKNGGGSWNHFEIAFDFT